MMKTSWLSFAVVLTVVGLASCRRDPQRADDHHTTPGEAAGKAAYEIKEGAKKAAKEIGKDIKSFSRDAKEGYQEQKQKDLERKRSREAEEKK